MTISTPRTDPLPAPAPAPAPAAQRAFTLAEVIIAATISVFVLAGILSAFLMIGRTGFLASSYSELESETRQGLDVFGQDVRKATNITWNDSQSITLAVATTTNATSLVTYAYDSTPGTPTTGCFYRLVGAANSALPRRILIHRIAADFAFHRFKLERTGQTDNTADNDAETKQLEVTMRASRAGATTVAANQSALSARYILRNKRVSN